MSRRRPGLLIKCRRCGGAHQKGKVPVRLCLSSMRERVQRVRWEMESVMGVVRNHREWEAETSARLVKAESTVQFCYARDSYILARETLESVLEDLRVTRGREQGLDDLEALLQRKLGELRAPDAARLGAEKAARIIPLVIPADLAAP